MSLLRVSWLRNWTDSQVITCKSVQFQSRETLSSETMKSWGCLCVNNKKKNYIKFHWKYLLVCLESEKLSWVKKKSTQREMFYVFGWISRFQMLNSCLIIAKWHEASCHKELSESCVGVECTCPDYDEWRLTQCTLSCSLLHRPCDYVWKPSRCLGVWWSRSIRRYCLLDRDGARSWSPAR